MTIRSECTTGRLVVCPLAVYLSNRRAVVSCRRMSCVALFVLLSLPLPLVVFPPACVRERTRKVECLTLHSSEKRLLVLSRRHELYNPLDRVPATTSSF